MNDSNKVTRDSLVDLIFHLKWNSDIAVHTDCYHAKRVNIWRDLIPPDLLEIILNKTAGDRIQMPVNNGAVVKAFSDEKILNFQATRFNRRVGDDQVVKPRLGRFYPKGKLKGISGIFSNNIEPFRCVGLNNGDIKVDFNHPLSGRKLDLSAMVANVEKKELERGGASIDWMETLTSGPGMQTRWQKLQTDFFSDGSFNREDQRPDPEFYQEPRFVHHLDATAREMVKNTYGRFLTDGMRVLDLMSSWESHIPERTYFDQLMGLGLNKNEMRKNADLSDFRIQDLNADATLPFASDTFDAVINTASIEYLNDPIKIFKEVWRVLRSDGYFIVTFSNRWFRTKAIQIWSELHEFERMGLVLEYFLRAGGYGDLHTYSIRGLPRPYDDKYFPELPYSDPVYAVWGRKK